MTTTLIDPFTLAPDGPAEDPRLQDPRLPADAEYDDPEAPYGYNPKGKPYRKSTAARQADAAMLTEARAAARAAKNAASGITWGSPPKGSTTAAKAAASGVVNRRDAALGVIQLPAFALGVLGRFWRPLAYDSLALAMHAEPIADGLVAAAEKSPSVARVLDRAADIGPWGILVAALVPLVAQVAANHGFIPDGSMGTTARGELDTYIATAAPTPPGGGEDGGAGPDADDAG